LNGVCELNWFRLAFQTPLVALGKREKVFDFIQCKRGINSAQSHQKLVKIYRNTAVGSVLSQGLFNSNNSSACLTQCLLDF
jgi:hypothetical protein